MWNSSWNTPRVEKWFKTDPKLFFLYYSPHFLPNLVSPIPALSMTTTTKHGWGKPLIDVERQHYMVSLPSTHAKSTAASLSLFSRLVGIRIRDVPTPEPVGFERFSYLNISELWTAAIALSLRSPKGGEILIPWNYSTHW